MQCIVSPCLCCVSSVQLTGAVAAARRGAEEALEGYREQVARQLREAAVTADNKLASTKHRMAAVDTLLSDVQVTPPNLPLPTDVSRDGFMTSCPLLLAGGGESRGGRGGHGVGAPGEGVAGARRAHHARGGPRASPHPGTPTTQRIPAGGHSHVLPPVYLITSP